MAWLLVCFGLLAACATRTPETPVAEQATATVRPTLARPATRVPTRVATSPVMLPTVPPPPTIAPALLEMTRQQEALRVAIYERSSPAVVSIDVLTDFATAMPDTHPPIPDLTIPSTGSGFIFDAQGHIVTNNHVVANASMLQVTFHDQSSATARVVGTDPGSDLAVIKVNALPTGTTPLPLGDSTELAVGQTAIAIGNPFGLQNTLTVGVISGLGRSLIGPAMGEGNFSIPNIIQSDAAINPGNSGGPLLNVQGEVIGVNTAISSQTGRFDGVGYAIPSRVVARVVPVLISEGSYEHAWMGIAMISVNELLMSEFDLGIDYGVLVTGVQEDSPASRAGLRVGSEVERYAGQPLRLGGDIIIAVNGQEMRTSDDLISYLQLETRVGDTLELTILRDGTQQQVDLTLESRP